MTNFKTITETPRTLGDFLSQLPVARGPWDEEFHRIFCSTCKRTSCDGDGCPYEGERNNPTWWLMMEAKKEQYVWKWMGGDKESKLKMHIHVEKRNDTVGAALDVDERDLKRAFQIAEKVREANPDVEIWIDL